jgi:30S ribosomal protein S31
MGKGDKKTAKGKRIIGSYGNVRKRKTSANAVVVEKTTKVKAEKPAAEKKPAAKKESATKKTTTKKAASETK